MNNVKKIVIDKINISLFMIIFFFALIITQAKPNLNHVDADHIAKINGIGEKKSKEIVMERDKNGYFKNKDDFYIRVINSDKYRVGDKSYEKIVKKYHIGD